MTRDLPLARWLSNSRICLRAPALPDARAAERWWIGPPPHDEETIARELRKRESIPWGGNPVLTLVAVSHGDGEIVGGVVVTRSANRTSRLEVRVASEHLPRGEVLTDMLGLVVPWLLDELGLMTVVLETPDDDVALLSAAKEAGMVEAVRRREHIVREHGRVDLLQLERVNLEWGRYAG